MSNLENIAKEPFQIIISYLSLYDVVQLATANKALFLFHFVVNMQALHKSVARLPRWVDFSFPKEYLSHYDRPILKEKYISVKKTKKKYYSDDDTSNNDSYSSESEEESYEGNITRDSLTLPRARNLPE
jgi:hypothetical protein